MDGMGELETRRWMVIAHLVNQFVMLDGGPDQWPAELTGYMVKRAFMVCTSQCNSLQLLSSEHMHFVCL